MDKDADLKLDEVKEPVVTFPISARNTYSIVSEDVNETVVEISGYDLKFMFNEKYLNSVADVECACKGISELFKKIIMQRLLDANKQNN